MRPFPRRDYSYRDFESMIVEIVDDETDTTPSHKRKRNETKEPSASVPVPHRPSSLTTMDQDNAFEELRKAFSHKMQRLQEKSRTLRDERHQERERHQKTEEDLL